MKELPYERDAMNNKPMPDGLDRIDQTMYQGLASLYARFHIKAIDRDSARKEKGVMLRDYEVAKKLDEFHTELAFSYADKMKRADLAASNYARDRTLENADRLYTALYGVPVGGGS